VTDAHGSLEDLALAAQEKQLKDDEGL
jgi:hypothetical protein